MLQSVLEDINNWFEKSTYAGEFAISGGSLEWGDSGREPMEGQYYRIIGSVFNDGLHKHGDNGLKDETFRGEVWLLAVPKAVIELSEEVSAYVAANPDSAKQSESFGGYSYTNASGQDGRPLGWAGVFGSRLNKWRKI